jgi:hypothetical protein
MTSLEDIRLENERLKKELDAIELEKAKKEQENLRAQLEEKKRLDLEAHDKELITRVKAELGIGVQSKAPETTQVAATKTGKSGFEEYKEGWVARHKAKGHNVTGRSYVQVLEDLQREAAFR